ncbi:helix-turn-helix domain-containing protein [uncultured Eubacterium sp.]|uniref:helix-turn-helix domain-containing protein n=1 Tax=uncultured Eubacterium sp. TaxID=165185 RepID=UPI0026723616|nr:helix-turn-helix transcriptional regulator [uncultured Eubacterium sp.]
MNTFGAKIRSLRESLELSQQEVANYIGCSSKVLSNYELDKRELDFETFIKLCDFFNVTADYLLSRTENPKYFKEMVLSSQAENLLYYFDKLPEQYKKDVIRYAKLNLLDIKDRDKNKYD